MVIVVGICALRLDDWEWYDVVVLVAVPSNEAVFFQSSDSNWLPRSFVNVVGTPHVAKPIVIGTREFSLVQKYVAQWYCF